MAAVNHHMSDRGAPVANWGNAGFPPYVMGWCCKAREGTMQQGFEDVGYLFATHLGSFRPETIPARLWRRRVRLLREHIETANHTGIRYWFRFHYPLLMNLVPASRYREFARGVIERVASIESSSER